MALHSAPAAWLCRNHGDVALLEFAYLAENAPEPFKSEWSGNTTQVSQMVHHKFVVTDFNGARPTVFTGSSNMAQGGEKENGDHLIRIEDRKIAIAYAIEALKLFDYFPLSRQCQSTRRADHASAAEAPQYYRPGHVKERDRKLFAG